jgi:hypothetical protein
MMNRGLNAGMDVPSRLCEAFVSRGERLSIDEVVESYR